MDTQRLVGIYLNNHLTLANGGVELFRRVARQHRDSEMGDDLARLAEEVAEDRAVLRRLMHRLGVDQNRPMTALGYVAERAGRLKPNGYLLRRSPLTDVIELEGMRDAVAAKISGWQVLRAVAAHDQRVTREEVEGMIERAQDQADRLYRLHLRVTEDVLSATEPAS